MVRFFWWQQCDGGENVALLSQEGHCSLWDSNPKLPAIVAAIKTINLILHNNFQKLGDVVMVFVLKQYTVLWGCKIKKDEIIA